MILISWFKEMKEGKSFGTNLTIPVVPNHIGKLLLDLLACVDPAFPSKDSCVPYSELSRTYSKMRNEVTQLLSAAESSGKFTSALSSIKINLESLTADDAINFASKLPRLSNENSEKEAAERLVIDDLESVKQRLLTTSSYLKCVQVGCCSIISLVNENDNLYFIMKFSFLIEVLLTFLACSCTFK